MKRRTGLAALAILVGLTAVAIARPGGGESYSGGGGHYSSSSSGGHSSGGGGIGLIIDLIRLVYWVVQLVVAYPYIGWPIIIMIVGWIAYSKYREWKDRDWNSGPPVALDLAVKPGALMAIRGNDPNFSAPVFEDFAFRLYAEAQLRAHDPKELAKVAPYVGEAARASLAKRTPAGVPVVGVVIGAMRVVGVDAGKGDGRQRIRVELEADLETAKHTYFVVDRWVFARDAAVQSKAPDRTRVFKCPNCDAPWAAKDTGTEVCASCGQAVVNGRFAWVLDSAEQRSVSERGPTLTTEVEERGTDLPTYQATEAQGELMALIDGDPQTTFGGLIDRLKLIYDQMNTAWTAGDLRTARGLLSDGLYDYLSYWMRAYQKQHLKNQLDDMRVLDVQLAKVTRDQFYDAVTLRVFATGKDYVVDTESGELVRGKKHGDRKYSEYWTLLRAKGRKGAPKHDPVCGNCGAPLAINQSGECESCGVHLTAGEFDWVLSKIEQDDSYRG